MDVKNIRSTRTEYEMKIKALLVKLEQKTDVYVHYLDFDRFEVEPNGVGPIDKVNIAMGLDES